MQKISRISYDFWALLILIFYVVFQVAQWKSFPQHLDMYYHLLTAWGFIKAGGYTIWDFWQNAPVGRPHIYPPIFHVALAILIKAGIDKIFLARLFCAAVPLVFIFVLWNFLRKKFSSLLALLSLITIASSYTFFASLANHIPSTIAMTFGILSIWQLLNKKLINAIILLTLSFYTHIGASYFMAASIFIYGLLKSDERRIALSTVASAVILSIPMIILQLSGFNLTAFLQIKENFFCEFKTIDYILAAAGIVILLRARGAGKLFLAFFAASFIFIPYAFRLFSAEGYLSIALLSAVALYGICESFPKRPFRYALYAIIIFMLIFSPTVAMGQARVGGPVYRIYIFDSCLTRFFLPGISGRSISQSAWFENRYNFASKLIRENSREDEIIYSPDDIIGLCLAVDSGRATANYLLPEAGAPPVTDPFAVSKIIVILKYHNRESVKEIADKYGFEFLGKNDIFDIYRNPYTDAKICIKKPVFRFL